MTTGTISTTADSPAQPAVAEAAQTRAEANRSAFAAPGSTICKTSISTFPATGWWSSPGPADRAKARWLSTRSIAEGQRQYIESLSVYARQFLHQMERPDVDLIEGLQPTISIDQRAGSQNPRSTVATVTEIYDHLRLLMARLGTPHCYQCGAPIRQQSPEEIQEELLAVAGRHQGHDPGPDGPRPERAASAKCSPRSAKPAFSGRASTAKWSTSTVRPS